MIAWLKRRYWGYTLVVGGFNTRDREVMKSGLEIFFGTELR